MKNDPLLTIIATLESPAARVSSVAGATGVDGIAVHEGTSTVVERVGECTTNTRLTVVVDGSLVVIKEVLDGGVFGKVADGNTVVALVGVLGINKERTVKAHWQVSSAGRKVDFNGKGVCAAIEGVINEGEGSFGLYNLDKVLEAVCGRSDIAIRHVVSEDFLAVQIGDVTVARLDGEREISVRLGMIDAE